AIPRCSKFACNSEAQSLASTSHHDGLHHERASLPAAETSKDGTKQIEAGTLCDGSNSRQAARISPLRISVPAHAPLLSGSERKTMSATTIAPVIGLFRILTNDICTLG